MHWQYRCADVLLLESFILTKKKKKESLFISTVFPWEEPPLQASPDKEGRLPLNPRLLQFHAILHAQSCLLSRAGRAQRRSQDAVACRPTDVRSSQTTKPLRKWVWGLQGWSDAQPELLSSVSYQTFAFLWPVHPIFGLQAPIPDLQTSAPFLTLPELSSLRKGPRKDLLHLLLNIQNQLNKWNRY